MGVILSQAIDQNDLDTIEWVLSETDTQTINTTLARLSLKQASNLFKVIGVKYA